MIVYYQMANLDDESLFTKIPLNKTINNCVSDLHNKNLYNEKLDRRDLFKPLEIAAGRSFLFLIICITDKLTSGNGFSVGSYFCKCISMPLWKRMVG